MAAAFFNALANPAKAHAISAGTNPGERVHPEVLTVMREEGFDLGSVKPQKLTEELARGVNVLVTMGCGEECPFIPGARVEDWPLADPQGQSMDTVRRIRDEIRARVDALIRRDDLGSG
jgi:arsenate reductase (thioredoxin)